MSRYKKDWSARWNGHTIRVEKNQFDQLGRTETCLFVDGVLIHQSKDTFRNPVLNVTGEFEDETGKHQIQTKFGATNPTAILCHIYVDDELVGGDVQRKMPKMPLTKEEVAQLPMAEQKKRLKRAIFWQLIGMAPAVFLYFVLGTYLKPISDHTAIIILSLWWLCQVLSNVYKLRVLPPENPTEEPKNSTPV